MKILILLGSLLSLNLFGQNLLLADYGKSSYRIVVSKAATESESKAASDFQKLFRQVSGVQLPITSDVQTAISTEIVIGNTSRNHIDLSSLSQDGILLRSVGSKLFINGGNRKGVHYAIAEFFERYLGTRFYALDEMKILSKSKVLIPQVNYTYSPPFTYRSQYNIESLDKTYADFHKLNYFFENRLYFAHSFGWLIPADKYFKTHPEYFALINGRRDPSQMCFSSNGLLKELISVLKIEMQLSPANKVWSVSTLDSPNYCHCSFCEVKYKSGSGFTESLIPFVNKVAEAFPDKTISTLAYNQSIIPALKSKPLPNVEIMFCYTDIDRKVPIDDPANAEAKMFRNALAQWKKQTNNIFVWDYVVNYFHSLSPFPNLYTLKPNLQYFRNQGIQKVFEQGIGPQKGEFSELKSYLLSKLLWNPDLDDRKIIEEFVNVYYGPGAPDVLQYLNEINQAPLVGGFLGVYTSPESFIKGFLSASRLEKYQSILQKALSKVPPKSLYYKRIKKELLTVQYACLMITRGINGKMLDNKRRTDLENFIIDMQKADVKFLRNGEQTPAEFQSYYLKNQ